MSGVHLLVLFISETYIFSMSKFEKDVLSLVASGEKLNVRGLGEKVGCSRYTVYKILRKHKVSPVINRQYTINEAVFDELTPATAWLLGFIFADGGIARTSLKIHIRDKDVDVLEKSRELFGSDTPIKKTYSKKDKTYFVTLLIANKTITTVLREKYGCGENKTFAIEYPNLPLELNSHFIRGYFDGDGSIMEKRGRKYGHSSKVGVDITSNETFLLKLQEILASDCNLNILPLKTRHPERNNNIRTLRYTGNTQGRRIYEYLYKDCGKYYMARKKTRFEEILAQAPIDTLPKKLWEQWEVDLVVRLPITEVAKLTGRTKASIVGKRMLLKKQGLAVFNYP